jgi:hypothetical protein
VWGALERYWKPIREKREGARRRSGTLHLAQAQSNRGRRGRKRDFRDAERLVKRLVSRELILSFVPDAEQRLWRTVTRKKYQLRCDRVRLQNQVEALLEEAHIKLSSLVSDLLGLSARRMLKALANGETNPAALAALAHERLRATPEQLCDALGACTELNDVYRRLLKMGLEELRLIEEQMGQLDQEMAVCLASTRTPSNGWRRCPVWAWTPRSRSLPKSVPPQRPFPPRNLSPRGWVPALAASRAPASITATDLRRATATCGAFSTRRPTPQSRLKEASSRLSIAARYHVSDTNKPSEPLPIDSVG